MMGTQSPEICREKKQTHEEKLCTKLALRIYKTPKIFGYSIDLQEQGFQGNHLEMFDPET